MIQQIFETEMVNNNNGTYSCAIIFDERKYISYHFRIVSGETSGEI